MSAGLLCRAGVHPARIALSDCGSLLKRSTPVGFAYAVANLAKLANSAGDATNSSLTDNGSRITPGEGIDFSSDFSFVGNADPAATGRVQMFDRAFVGFVIRGLNVLFETLQTAPTEVLRISQTGNVGIGTPFPGQKLEVVGNVKVSGAGNAIIFPDNTVMTSAGAGTNGGTITGVTAGAGLTASPANPTTAGGVTLSVANGGITNAMLAANSVTDTNVAANANIAISKIAPGFLTTAAGDVRYAQLASANTLSGSLTAAGGMQLPATATATETQGFSSSFFDVFASVFNSGTATAQNQKFRWQADPVGNNTASPSAQLSLLFGSAGATPTGTGLSIASTGIITFASRQTFPGAGGGTITAVNTAAGSGLQGGATSGAVNLSLLTSCAANQVLQWTGSAWACAFVSGVSGVTSISTAPGSGIVLTPSTITSTGTIAIDTAVVLQLGATANTFTGSITASSFSGNSLNLPATTNSTTGVITLGGIDLRIALA
jgi:hypothetical protein